MSEDTIKLRAIQYGEAVIEMDRAEYQGAKAAEVLDQWLDNDLSDIDTETILVEPNGNFAFPHSDWAWNAQPNSLRGPWTAVLYGQHQQVWDGIEAVPLGTVANLAVVKGTAAPVNGVMPSTWNNCDDLYRHYGIELDDADHDELAVRWQQAQRVALLLNACPGGSE